MAKTIFFSDELVDLVRKNLNKACSDGSCVTYDTLAEMCGMSKDDISVLREVVNREFKGDNDGDVEVVKGPRGGLGFRGMKRPEAVQKDDESMDPAWIAQVHAKLEEVLTDNKPGVSADMLAGLLGSTEPNDVRKAVKAIPGFELAKGVGIRRCKPVATETSAQS